MQRISKNTPVIKKSIFKIKVTKIGEQKPIEDTKETPKMPEVSVQKEEKPQMEKEKSIQLWIVCPVCECYEAPTRELIATHCKKDHRLNGSWIQNMMF
ncbi:hypothetical protein pb186bvf_019319 [Paramecium bursaria]